MMTLQKAMATLDSVIPPPDNKMVDPEHSPIAVAWKECRKALATYDDMQSKHDTLMLRWGRMVETIRKKIDTGTLTAEDRRLLDDLNLPHRYDKRMATSQDIFEEIAPLTMEDLKEMEGEPLWVVPMEKNPDWKPRWAIFNDGYIFVPSESSESRMHLLRIEGDYERTWLAYRQKPGVCGK